MAIKYHSQPATRQDEWVFSKFPQPGGYFIEIGAHDGIRHSNTLTLENFGWNGLLVEANPNLFETLKKNRPKAAVSNACIGPHDGGSHRFLVGQGGSDAFSGLESHMSDAWIEEHNCRSSFAIHLPTKSFRTLLEEQGCPKVIDYLSLDVEGAEYAILSSFFHRPGIYRPDDYRFDLITVEFRYDRLLLDRLERLLERHYILDEVRAFDACFIHRNFGDSHARAA